MATGYYTLSGVDVAAGDSVLTAAQISAPGSAPGPVNFLNLIGPVDAEGTPSGAIIVGPDGHVAVARHATGSTTLQLSKPWVGGAIAGGAAEVILGINALPIGRLAALITEIITLRPLLRQNNLIEYAGDAAAQADVRANIGAVGADLLAGYAALDGNNAFVGANSFGARPSFNGKAPWDSGNLPYPGVVLDQVYAEFKSAPALTAIIPLDGLVPQSTEGTQVLAASITPKSATNRIHARFVAYGTVNAIDNLIAALFVGSAANAVRASYVTIPLANAVQIIVLDYEHVPGVATAQTYSVRMGPSGVGNTATINGNVSFGVFFGAAAGASLTLSEIRVP